MNKQETYDYLTAHGAVYEITEHPAVYNMEEVAELHLPYPEADAKNLFVKDSHGHYYLLSVEGSKRVDLKAFRKAKGLRNLSFASPEEMMELMGLIPGAVTPLGLLNDEGRKIELYLDETFAGKMIGVHPNDNTATVWMQADDLVRILKERGSQVHVVPVEARPSEPAPAPEAADFEFRSIRAGDLAEAKEIAEIERICFPPHEACPEEMMLRRAAAAPEMFLVAIDRRNGRIAGFLNGLATKEDKFRDAFFEDPSLYDKEGGTVMLLGLDVRPEYRRRGLAGQLMRHYAERERQRGRKRLVLTCLEEKIPMYEHLGYKDLGLSASLWGGETWQEMDLGL